MLRLNTAITAGRDRGLRPVVACGGTPSRLGVLDGDLCGFPNGRRLLDDVTDIELRAIAQGYGPCRSTLPSAFPEPLPNNLVGDGVDTNDDNPFLEIVPVHRAAAPGVRGGPADDHDIL